MDRVGGFDPGVGILPLRDGAMEIGRGNLPEARRLLPGDVSGVGAPGDFGRLGDSAIMERFAPYLSARVTHRELLSPDVFFSSLEEAADAFIQRAKADGAKDGPLLDAAATLAEVIGNRELCEMLRNLVLKV